MKYEVCVMCSSMEISERESQKIYCESERVNFQTLRSFFAFSIYSGKSSQSPFVREVLQEPQVDEDFLNEFY